MGTMSPTFLKAATQIKGHKLKEGLNSNESIIPPKLKDPSQSKGSNNQPISSSEAAKLGFYTLLSFSSVHLSTTEGSIYMFIASKKIHFEKGILVLQGHRIQKQAGDPI